MSSTKRRLNYTGRKKILQSDISVKVFSKSNEDNILATLKLDLTRYDFPPDAKIVFEAFSGSSTQRFDCGTASHPEIPQQFEIDNIKHSGSVNFRIKVVDLSEIQGILLGFAKIRPGDKEKQDEKRPFFPVNFSDISPEIWRVEINETEPPSLVINSKIPNVEYRLATDSVIQATVLPAALKLVLNTITKIEFIDDNDEEEWHEEWLEFCVETLGMEPIAEVDHANREDWVNNAVREFCRINGFLSNLQKSMED